MNRKWVWLAIGFYGIWAAGQNVASAESPETIALPAKTASQLAEQNQELLRENEKLRARLAELEHVAADAPVKKVAPEPGKADGPPAAPAPAAAAPAPPDFLGGGQMENIYGEGEGKSPPRDLTLRNFFSAGWNDEWVKRRRETGTPDMALLRVQTNFLEREVRANYLYEPNINSKTKADLNQFDALIAWGFNRRFMIETLETYQWFDTRDGSRTVRGVTTPVNVPDIDGGIPKLVGRLQLVDTEPSSISFNFQCDAPNRGTGEKQTIIRYGLAGFEDMAYWAGLNRVGLYYSVLFDSFAGPRAAGAKQSDVQYDITVAKTLTRPDMPYFGNFTLFVENFAQTDLSGDHKDTTLVSITPGFRFNLGVSPKVKFGVDNWIMGGVDIPVAGPKPWDAVYRLTYIKNF
jgi:hypothetical protein